jgi:N6-L-threonylcarbamoyladenine synthase
MKSMMEQLHGKVFYPRTEFCTDNGAMIAYAGMQRFKKGVSASSEICVFPRWPLSSIDEMYSSKSV